MNKKKILIGSIFAALLIASMPLASTLEATSVSTTSTIKPITTTSNTQLTAISKELNKLQPVTIDTNKVSTEKAIVLLQTIQNYNSNVANSVQQAISSLNIAKSGALCDYLLSILKNIGSRWLSNIWGIITIPFAFLWALIIAYLTDSTISSDYINETITNLFLDAAGFIINSLLFLGGSILYSIFCIRSPESQTMNGNLITIYPPTISSTGNLVFPSSGCSCGAKIQ